MTAQEVMQFTWTRSNMASTFDRVKRLYEVRSRANINDMERLDLRSIPGLEATFQSHGTKLRELLAKYPDDPAIQNALAAWEAYIVDLQAGS